MEHIELINGNIELHPKKNSHQIILFKKNEADIIDIELNVYTYAIWSQFRSPYLKLDEADDINFYINLTSENHLIESINITNSVLNQIEKDLLENKEMFANQFSNCLRNLIRKQENGGFSDTYIVKSTVLQMLELLEESDKNIVNFLYKDWKKIQDDNLKVFGNNTPFHISNFLGWGIQTPKISLKKICLELNVDFDNITGVTLSAGKDPLIDENFESYGTGGLNYSLVVSKHNPLDEFVIRLMDILTETSENVEILLTQKESLIEDLTRLSSDTKNLEKELSSVLQRVNQLLSE